MELSKQEFEKMSATQKMEFGRTQNREELENLKTRISFMSADEMRPILKRFIEKYGVPPKN